MKRRPESKSNKTKPQASPAATRAIHGFRVRQDPLEEAWDSLDEDSHVELLEYDGMGGFPGGGWRWTISACDLDDGRRIYTDMQSGNLPQPGIYLIAVTNQPGTDADTLVVEAFRRSEHGQFLQGRWDPDTGEWKDETGDGS